MNEISLRVSSFYETSWFEPTPFLERVLAVEEPPQQDVLLLAPFKSTLASPVKGMLPNGKYSPLEYASLAPFVVENSTRIFKNDPSSYLLGEDLTLFLPLPPEPVKALVFSFFDRNSAEWGGEIEINGRSLVLPFQEQWQLCWLSAEDLERGEGKGIRIKFLKKRICLSKLEMLLEGDFERERNFWVKWKEKIAAETEHWMAQKSQILEDYEKLEIGAEALSRLAPTKQPSSRSLPSLSPSAFLPAFRAHLTQKLSNPGAYGIHPFLCSLSVSLRHYVRKRKKGFPYPFPLDPGIMRVREESSYRTHQLTLDTLSGLLEMAMETGDLEYVERWKEGVVLWLRYPFPTLGYSEERRLQGYPGDRGGGMPTDEELGFAPLFPEKNAPQLDPFLSAWPISFGHLPLGLSPPSNTVAAPPLAYSLPLSFLPSSLPPLPSPFSYTSTPFEIQDLEYEQVFDLVTQFRYFGTLCQFFPRLWEALPTKLILSIIFRLSDVILPTYVTYLRTNSQNWRYVTAPVLFSWAILLEEWKVTSFCWSRALEEVETASQLISLRDGTMIQQDPWYQFMLFHHADVIELLRARRQAAHFLPDYEAQVLRGGELERLIFQNMAGFTRFLAAHIQYNTQYPLSARMDARDMTPSLCWTDGICSGIGDHPLLLPIAADPAARSTSCAFPYGGFYTSKGPLAYAFLFNSPRPGAGAGYRSRYNNNFVTVSIKGKNYLLGSEKNKYDWVDTPVQLLREGTKRFSQDFHIGVPIDSNLATRHKGYLVSAWNHLPRTSLPARYYFGKEYDVIDSIYRGPFTCGAEKLWGWHRRRLLHHKALFLFIIIDDVMQGEEGLVQLWLDPAMIQGKGEEAPGYLQNLLLGDGMLLSLSGSPLFPSPSSSSSSPSFSNPLLSRFSGQHVTLLRPQELGMDEIAHWRDFLLSFAWGGMTDDVITKDPGFPSYDPQAFQRALRIRDLGVAQKRDQAGDRIFWVNKEVQWKSLLFWDLKGFAPPSNDSQPLKAPYMGYYRLVLDREPGTYALKIPVRYGYPDHFPALEIYVKINSISLSLCVSAGTTQPITIGSRGVVKVEILTLVYYRRETSWPQESDFFLIP